MSMYDNGSITEQVGRRQQEQQEAAAFRKLMADRQRAADLSAPRAEEPALMQAAFEAGALSAMRRGNSWDTGGDVPMEPGLREYMNSNPTGEEVETRQYLDELDRRQRENGQINMPEPVGGLHSRRPLSPGAVRG